MCEIQLIRDIYINANIREEERSQIQNLSFPFKKKKLEKG